MILLNSFCFFIFAHSIRANVNSMCGEHSIESLQTEIIYRSEFGTEPLKIRIGNEMNNEKVRVGFYTTPDNAIHCVAIKFMRGAVDLPLFKNSINVMKKIQEMPKEQRKHLIETIDAGYTSPYGENILIMELGVESLHERLNEATISYANDHDMMNAIKQLAQPLFEFHKIAIHLDVNPRNYLYVSENGNLVLKLIDFEGAHFTDISKPNKNECVSIHQYAFTPEYTGPEYYDANGREISTKFDIWSVGIIVFEMLVNHLRVEQKRAPLAEDEIKSLLFAIGDLFLGFTRNRTYPELYKNEQIDYSESKWIENNTNALEIVLRLWEEFPRTALLVTNLLNVKREKRLTAQGILNYIGGLCQIEEFKEIRNSEELRIFNSMNFGEFLKKLRFTKITNKLKFLKENRCKLNESYKRMKRMLKKVIKEQEKEVEERRRNGTSQLGDCETA